MVLQVGRAHSRTGCTATRFGLDNKPATKRGCFLLSAEMSRISDRDSIVSAQSSPTVRVFGYPPDKARAMVAYFRRLGNIAKHAVGSGNWLDIEYRDQDEFERARGTDGQQIDLHTLVGPGLAGSLGPNSAKPNFSREKVRVISLPTRADYVCAK